MRPRRLRDGVAKFFSREQIHSGRKDFNHQVYISVYIDMLMFTCLYICIHMHNESET